VKNQYDGAAFPHFNDPHAPENMRHGLTKKQWFAGCWLMGAMADPANRMLSPVNLAEKAAVVADAMLTETANGL